MIKILRKGAIERPWVLRILMLLISLAFVITMGWWGFGASSQPSNRIVANVGNEAVLLDEYQAAYDRAERFYRDLFKEQFNDDLLRQLNIRTTVVNDLVDRRLWLMAAKDLGVKVSDRELSEFILEQEAFKRNGRFDPEQYRRVLARARLTPEKYEALQREDLLVDKVQGWVKASVAVTEMELQQVQNELSATEASSSGKDQEAIRGLLLRKQQMALESYLDGLKTNIPVSIDEKML